MSSNLITIAWRNLGRNRRRTLITGSALALGTALCVGAYGFVDGWSADMLRTLTRLDLGHLQAHHEGYPRRRLLRLTVPDAARVVAALRAHPDIVAVTTRTYGYALVSHGSKSSGVQLVGIDPVHEPQVTELQQQTSAGRYLPDQPTRWPRGVALSEAEQAADRALTEDAEAEVREELEGLRELSPADGPAPGAELAAPGAAGQARRRRAARTEELARKLSPPPARPPPVYVGAALARILKVDAGDELHLLSQTVDGMTEEIRVRVIGMFRTGTEQYDRSRIYLQQRDLQRLTHLYDRVHEVAAATREPDQAQRVARELQAALELPHLLVRSWDQIRPDIQAILALNEAGMIITIGFIFVVATLGVINTMLMAVFERTRELGMLKAIGMRGSSVLWLMVIETTLLALGGAAIGTLLGLGIDAYLVLHGLDLRSITGGISIGGLGVSPVMYGAITARGLVVPTVLLTLSCFIGSFYPAIRAARLPPAAGMREA